MTPLKLNKIPLSPKRPFVRPQFARTGSAPSLAFELRVFLFEDGSGGFSSGLFTLPDVFLAFALDFIKFLQRVRCSGRGTAEERSSAPLDVFQDQG